MHHNFNFKDVLASAQRSAWAIEDVLPPGSELDFDHRFMPESLARTAAAPFLDADEKKILNQIRGHEYLSIFGLVEEFILPFVLDHARPQLSGDDDRIRALLQFASEEAKHIQLFKRFHALFGEGFATPCAVIGPPEAIAAEVLRHDPLAVALVILMIEWVTQTHYLGSIRDDAELDPMFKSLLRHHWIEEAQHAKLDTLIVASLAESRDSAGIDAAIDGFLEIGAFLDDGLARQAGYNLDALALATGRALSPAERAELESQQHQALRWTYLGSGLVHPRFVTTLRALSPSARQRIGAAARHFQ